MDKVYNLYKKKSEERKFLTVTYQSIVVYSSNEPEAAKAIESISSYICTLYFTCKDDIHSVDICEWELRGNYLLLPVAVHTSVKSIEVFIAEGDSDSLKALLHDLEGEGSITPIEHPEDEEDVVDESNNDCIVFYGQEGTVKSIGIFTDISSIEQPREIKCYVNYDIFFCTSKGSWVKNKHVMYESNWKCALDVIWGKSMDMLLSNYPGIKSNKVHTIIKVAISNKPISIAEGMLERVTYSHYHTLVTVYGYHEGDRKFIHNYIIIGNNKQGD